MKRTEWEDEFNNVKDEYIFDFDWTKIKTYSLKLNFPAEQLSYLTALAYKWNEAYSTRELSNRTYLIWELLENEIKRLKSIHPKRNSSKASKKENNDKQTNKSEITEPIEKVLMKFIKDSSETMRVTRRNIAAASLWVAFNEHHKKELNMTRIATIFMESGIWTEGKLDALQRTFRGLDPMKNAQKPLSDQIVNLF